ncbi:MAG TPA: thioredoxin fold domain-containing protein [Gammaproteobacteria bacterium]|nr:thioredoxin fold domain-containing protein [Gammaproteobacteria bacterium]
MIRQLFYLLVTASAVFYASAMPARAAVDVPYGTDLQQDGRQATARQLPILLVFSAVSCEYCRQLEDEFLEPMLISGEYTDKVIIRRLLLDIGQHATDFDGMQREAGAIATRYRAWLTPTIVFLDGTGREVAERIKGINTPELFGGYLDACIDTALLMIRDPASPIRYAGCDAVR